MVELTISLYVEEVETIVDSTLHHHLCVQKSQLARMQVKEQREKGALHVWWFGLILWLGPCLGHLAVAYFLIVHLPMVFHQTAATVNWTHPDCALLASIETPSKNDSVTYCFQAVGDWKSIWIIRSLLFNVDNQKWMSFSPTWKQTDNKVNEYLTSESTCGGWHWLCTAVRLSCLDWL